MNLYLLFELLFCTACVTAWYQVNSESQQIKTLSPTNDGESFEPITSDKFVNSKMARFGRMNDWWDDKNDQKEFDENLDSMWKRELDQAYNDALKKGKSKQDAFQSQLKVMGRYIGSQIQAKFDNHNVRELQSDCKLSKYEAIDEAYLLNPDKAEPKSQQ